MKSSMLAILSLLAIVAISLRVLAVDKPTSLSKQEAKSSVIYQNEKTLLNDIKHSEENFLVLRGSGLSCLIKLLDSGPMVTERHSVGIDNHACIEDTTIIGIAYNEKVDSLLLQDPDCGNTNVHHESVNTNNGLLLQYRCRGKAGRIIQKHLFLHSLLRVHRGHRSAALLTVANR